jgi:hypothetical protein
MNCCDEQGDCRQGRDCPVRVCRQRAGKPANYTQIENWVKDMDELEKEMEKQWSSDLKAIVFVAACVLSFFLIVWGTL